MVIVDLLDGQWDRELFVLNRLKSVNTPAMPGRVVTQKSSFQRVL